MRKATDPYDAERAQLFLDAQAALDHTRALLAKHAPPVKVAVPEREYYDIGEDEVQGWSPSS